MSVNLPQSLTTVTRLSKLIALVLFILFPILGFYLGVHYQKSVQPKEIYVTKNVPIIKEREDDYRSLQKRCGEMPSYQELGIKEGDRRFIRLNGPLWSPDCRHIAWSIDQYVIGGSLSTTSNDYIALDKQKPQSFEGLYLYSERTKETKRIYAGENRADYPVFIKWKDRNTIGFSVKGTNYFFDIQSNKILNNQG